MIDVLYFMLLNRDKVHDLNSLSTNIHVSKNKIERAIFLLKNQKFVQPTNPSLNFFKLDDDIKCCIGTREELEILVNRELTTPDDIMQAHSEAMIPNHSAISLDGEPMLYPRISEFVEEFRNRNMTTFIVTNGTLPERIGKLDHLPSQLYLTLPAPNEEIYKKVCRPMIRNGWEKISNSLDHLDSLSCRTLVRLTAVNNLNIADKYITEYVKIIEKTNPEFFEIKGFTLQAKALLISERLKNNGSVKEYFPDYDLLENFALKFEKLSGFPLIYRNEPSRDFLFAVNWDKDKDPKIKSP
jgi:tRNA wybutosine-synthesizing protein 1